MVHLLHRLYGVDAPVGCDDVEVDSSQHTHKHTHTHTRLTALFPELPG